MTSSICNKPILLCLLVVLLEVSHAQEKGFLTTYSETNHSWLVSDALETSNGEIIICSHDYWGEGNMLLKLSTEGDVLARKLIVATDTIFKAGKLFQLSEERGGELVVICLCSPNDGSTPALQFRYLDESLEVSWIKTIPCTFFDEGNGFFDAKFLLSNTGIYAALTSKLGQIPNAVFLTKIDFEGNLHNCHRLERDSLRSVCNLFHDEEGRIGLFGNIGPSHMGILTFDQSMNLLSRDSIFQWSSPEGVGGDFCHYSIMDMINGQAAKLPNGTCIVSSRLLESLYEPNGYLYADDRSAILAKYENTFHQPENMLVTEHMNDSVEYPAFYRSIDFRETDAMKCDVFQCVILNEFPQFGLLQPYPTGIVVTKTDQELNVEWKKRYLRNGNYQAMTINATADGGCLVVGSIGDYQSQRFDVFALKINEEGAVGLDEIQEENMAYVYPNPARETVRIGGVVAKETRIYNTLGQCVKTFRGNEYSIKDLSSGLYFFRVRDEKNKLQTLRIIVN